MQIRTDYSSPLVTEGPMGNHWNSYKANLNQNAVFYMPCIIQMCNSGFYIYIKSIKRAFSNQRKSWTHQGLLNTMMQMQTLSPGVGTLYLQKYYLYLLVLCFSHTYKRFSMLRHDNRLHFSSDLINPFLFSNSLLTETQIRFVLCIQ